MEKASDDEGVMVGRDRDPASKLQPHLIADSHSTPHSSSYPMSTEYSSARISSLRRHLSALALAFAGSALLFTFSASRLGADAGDPLPTIHFTQGLVGKQVCLHWDT